MHTSPLKLPLVALSALLISACVTIELHTGDTVSAPAVAPVPTPAPAAASSAASEVFVQAPIVEEVGVLHLEAEELGGDIGENVSDTKASGGGARRAELEEAGFLHIGPYNEDLVGTESTYEAVFAVQVDDNTSEEIVAVIDIVTETENLAGMELLGTDFASTERYYLFTLTFESPAEGKIEFRTKTTGVSAVTVDRISVREQDA